MKPFLFCFFGEGMFSLLQRPRHRTDNHTDVPYLAQSHVPMLLRTFYLVQMVLATNGIKYVLKYFG